MKKSTLILLLMLIVSPSALAQPAENRTSPPKEKGLIRGYRFKTRTGTPRRMKYRILQEYDIDSYGNPYTAHWSGFGFSFIDMTAIGDSGQPLDDVVDMGRSFRYDLGFFDLKKRIPEAGITIVTGLGIQFNSIHFNRNAGGVFIENDDHNALVVSHALEHEDQKNARLGVTYLTMPWLVEKAFLIGNIRDPFFINAGVELKLRTKQSSKSWWKESERGDFVLHSKKPGFSLFAYELKAQIGWRNIGLVGSWCPTSIMTKEAAAKNGIWSVGLKLYTSQR